MKVFEFFQHCSFARAHPPYSIIKLLARNAGFRTTNYSEEVRSFCSYSQQARGVFVDIHIYSDVRTGIPA